MKQVYFNEAQQEVIYTAARDTVAVMGRGSGKGAIHAAVLLRAMQAMPGCSVAVVGANAKRVLANTLPSMLQHWEAWGYRQGTHWFIGRRPPERLRWPSPLIRPQAWDNVLSLYNGSVGIIVSQDRAGTSNSKSFDFLALDEAKFLDYEQLKDETFQANRGQQAQFGECPWHHGMLVTSDMPVTRRGSWFMRYRQEADAELVEVLQGLVWERWNTERRLRREAAPPAYLARQLAAIDARLARLRRHALFYKEYSSFCNFALLGEEFYRRARRDLPYMTFRTSILCLPVGHLRDGFYSSMRPHHKYSATDFHYIDSLAYDFPRLARPDSRMDADLQPSRPLCIAFDFNANINWLVVGQPDEGLGRLNTLKSFYVKYERKLPELCADFARYYDHFPLKEVVFYHDHTALGSNYAVNRRDFRWVVCDVLRRLGWRVRPVYIGRALSHPDKHLLINQGFAGRNRLTPYFNEQNNEDLLLSIQTAGVYDGKKDKRGEKLAETEEDRLEARTDGSDAWDTLYIGCEKKPQQPVLLPVTSDFRR